jgi:hypothetical protein
MLLTDYVASAGIERIEGDANRNYFVARVSYYSFKATESVEISR